ncbi:VOC family protein [Wenyingzhuangia sp. IMCC45574]
MKINFTKLNHVQLCIPIGEEEKGRDFYCNLLGLEEIEKPKEVRHNGGFWCKIANVVLHIGTENLPPPSKRHPAFEVENIEAVKQYLISKGIRIKEDIQIPGLNRFSFYDYWDNRIELLEFE